MIKRNITQIVRILATLYLQIIIEVMKVFHQIGLWYSDITSWCVFDHGIFFFSSRIFFHVSPSCADFISLISSTQRLWSLPLPLSACFGLHHTTLIAILSIFYLTKSSAHCHVSCASFFIISNIFVFLVISTHLLFYTDHYSFYCPLVYSQLFNVFLCKGHCL